MVQIVHGLSVGAIESGDPDLHGYVPAGSYQTRLSSTNGNVVGKTRWRKSIRLTEKLHLVEGLVDVEGL